MLANVTQIRSHHGPWFQWWRRRMAASVGAVLLDETRDTR